MKNFEGENVLITTSDWFVAPDGRDYKAAWGRLVKVHDAKESFGIIPTRAHANWIIEIGDMMIMGCRVMYIIKCKDKPNIGKSIGWNSNTETGIKEYERPTLIYIAEND